MTTAQKLSALFDTHISVTEIEPKAFFSKLGYTEAERTQQRNNMQSIAELAAQIRRTR